MDSRVGELALTVRAPPARWGELRPRAEEFAARVLRRVAEMLEGRAPGRIVLLRSLDMRWRMWEAALERDSEVEAVAAEIAVSLDEGARRARSAPEPQDDLAVFEDESAWRASYLAVASRGGAVPWFFRRLAEEGDLPGALGRPDHGALAGSVIARLADRGVLAEVLHRLSLDALERLSAVVGGGGAPGPRARPGPDPAGGAEPWTGPDFAGARAGRGPSDAPPERRRRAIARLMAAASRTRPAPAGPPRARGEGDRAVARDPGAGPDVDTTQAAEERPAATEDTTSDRLARGADATDPRDDTEGEWLTGCGGLFYLLHLVLELDVGQLLWRACVDERALLALVADRWLGPASAGDAAAALFGGASVPARPPALARELQAELSRGLLASLVAATPRRGLAALPEMTLGVTGDRGHRLLVATPRGSSFVLFAAPVESPAEAQDALRRLLACWPAAAPAPRASPPLAELDPRGRVLAERGLSPGAWTPPGIDDAPTAAVVAQVVGAVGHLFASRAGAHEVVAPPALAARYLAIPGRVLAFGESMTVELPMDRIELDVRRAGLDRDPGWVQWLRKHVALRFVGGQTESRSEAAVDDLA